MKIRSPSWLAIFCALAIPAILQGCTCSSSGGAKPDGPHDGSTRDSVAGEASRAAEAGEVVTSGEVGGVGGLLALDGGGGAGGGTDGPAGTGGATSPDAAGADEPSSSTPGDGGGTDPDGELSTDIAVGGSGGGPGGSGAGGASGGGGQGGGGGTDVAPNPGDGGSPLTDGGPSFADTLGETGGEAGIGEAGGIDEGVPAIDGAGPDESAADGFSPSDAPGADAAPVPLAVSAGPARTICAGSSIQIGQPASGGSPAYVYAWSASPTCSGCISDPAAAQPVVSPAATTTFTVGVTDSASAVAGDSVTITVVGGSAPLVEAGPDLGTDPGAAVQIGSAAVAGTTYAWTCDRADCAIADPAAAQTTVRPALSTRYTVTATSAAGCMQTDTVVVWVNLPLTSSPADGEPAYPSNADLLVHFGAPVLASSLNATTVKLVEASSGTAVDFTSSYDGPSRTLAVVPTGANYNATIADFTLILLGGTSGVVSDDSLRPQLLPTDQLIDFSIVNAADTTAPTIVFRSPAPSATGVALNGAVVVGFSEALDPATIKPSTLYLSSSAGTAAATLAYDGRSDMVTLTPTAALSAATVYTAHVTGVADPAGNAMGATTWTFTTGPAPDTTPPTVTAVTPTNAANGVSVGTTVMVTFSEMVDQATLASGLNLSHSGQPTSGSVAYNASTRQATFTPATFLDSVTLYTITVSGVRDLAGNVMAATFSATFTTGGVLFSDSFENGTAQWVLGGPWALTTKAFKSASHSLTDSPAGSYATNINVSAVSVPFATGAVTTATVRFWLRGRTQSNQDRLYLEYTRDGSTWTQLSSYSGNMGWALRSQAVTFPAGTTMQIRFRLTSNNTKQYDGVYIDDVTVQAP